MNKQSDQRKAQAIAALKAVSIQPAPFSQFDALIVFNELKRLKRLEEAACAWYDSEYPAEDGHDQVRPWDHAQEQK